MTMHCLILLGSIILCVSNAYLTPDRAEERQNKIVGGSVVTIEQYPFQVSLQVNGQHFCGGSIIGRNAILTAAHCVRAAANAQITIRAGTSFWSSGGVIRSVGRILVHPKYDQTKSMDYDVAVLLLSRNLDYTKSIQPVGLPKSAVRDNDVGSISGWGALSETGGYPRQLMSTFVNVVNWDRCSRQYRPTRLTVTKQMICATAPNKDSCYGDSGGPFVSKGVQVGIVSWGYGCARNGFPGVYTNVISVADFISNVVGRS